MSKNITLIRVDPANRHVSRLTVKRSIPAIRRVMRAKGAEHEHVMDVDGNPLLVAFDPTCQGEGPGFRFKGGKEYRGMCVLIGLHNHRAVSCPVDLEWVNKRIAWVD